MSRDRTEFDILDMMTASGMDDLAIADFFQHRGVSKLDGAPGRGSGRYPLGSGDYPQASRDFLDNYKMLKDAGMSETDIAKAMHIQRDSTKILRAQRSIAVNDIKKWNMANATRLKAHGYSTAEIARILHAKNESTVRSWLDADRQGRANLTMQTADLLKDYVEEKKFLDIGDGSELYLGDALNAKISSTRLDAAVEMLKQQGYKVSKVYMDQLGTNHKTTISVLTKDDIPYSDIYKNRFQIKPVDGIVYDEDGNIGKLGLDKDLVSIDSSRVFIKYGDEGGTLKDGVIELRKGVDDISLGKAQYAQVRIMVDGDKYLKGMAMYSNDIPPGYDIVFNTNKPTGTPFDKVLKKCKTDQEGNVDMDNPFGATIKGEKDLTRAQRYYIDPKTGEKKLSAINVVNEEGNWGTWSPTLASQFLSKQNERIAKRQLDLTFAAKKAEFDDICALTNPTLKRKLLKEFSDDCDASAVHLKAAAFPGQRSFVILPFEKMKADEVYAPRYEDGTKVALVRYPHAGTFEIPILTVHNKGSVAAEMIFNAPDAIGINPKVAQRLSGADFDGDSVVLIPLSNKVNIRSTDPLPGLKDFDPNQYAWPEGVDHPTVGRKKNDIDEKHPLGGDGFVKGSQMGSVSNLITDMTLKGASPDELARAVRHSMVVIDAEKHDLDWKRSEKENDIRGLKKLYQGGENRGASTLISRAKGDYRREVTGRELVDEETGKRIYLKARDSDLYYQERKPVRAKDPETGKYLREIITDPITGKQKKGNYIYETEVDPETGKERVKKEFTGKTITRKEKITKMEATDDAFTLTSGGSREDPGTKMEGIYANYANSMKALANAARKEMISTPPMKKDPKVAKEYEKEVAKLNADLAVALKNAPKERYAQIRGNQVVKQKVKENGELDDEHLTRVKNQALASARLAVGAQKQKIPISDRQWEAIQKGAVSDSVLMKIFNNTDTDELKQRALPRQENYISESKKVLIRRMQDSGLTIAEMADRVGLSTSSITKVLAE